MDDRDGERQPLTDSQRQIQRSLVEIVSETEPSDQLGDARLRLFGAQMVEVRMKFEVLLDRKLRVERERLRHVADAIAGTHVARLQGLAEQQRLAVARRQQPGQHFHRRRLAAAVRAEKAEDLAALDGEVHAVHRREVAKSTGEVARDDDGLAVGWPTRRYQQLMVIAALPFRQQRDERLFQRRRAGPGLEFAGRPRRQHLAGVHRREPIEPLRFLHVGGGDHHAHAFPARAHAVDQLPELPARERIDAGGRLVEDQKVRIVDQTATQPELLPHAARKLLRRAIGKRRKPGAFEQFGDFPVPFDTSCPNRRPKNSMFSRTLRSA